MGDVIDTDLHLTRLFPQNLLHTYILLLYPLFCLNFRERGMEKEKEKERENHIYTIHAFRIRGRTLFSFLFSFRTPISLWLLRDMHTRVHEATSCLSSLLRTAPLALLAGLGGALLRCAELGRLLAAVLGRLCPCPSATLPTFLPSPSSSSIIPLE